MQLENLSLEKLDHKLPTKKMEAWKYTSLKSFSEIQWQVPKNENMDSVPQLNHEQMQKVSAYLNLDFHNFVFVNGRMDSTLSDEFLDNMHIEKLMAQDFVGLESRASEGSFLEVMQKNLQQKITLHLQPQVILDKPLQFVFVVKGRNIFNQTYLDVDLGENSQAQIIVHELSFDEFQDASAQNITGKITLDKSAQLKWLHVQNEKPTDYHFSRFEFSLTDRAQLISLDLSLGAAVARHYLAVTFTGQAGFAGVYGLCALNQEQHADHYTYLHHVKGENQSIQHYKNILGDSAQTTFRGRVRIEQDAQKANSEQLNNNLLLSRKAQANSIPQLEIYADDVKAGHGSTMGQLNQEEIFYFLSRGISQTQAIRMLSYGYALELVSKLENPKMESWLLNVLNQQLERLIPHV